MTAIAIYAGMFAVGRHGAGNGLDGFDQSAARFLMSCILLAPLALRRASGIWTRLGLFRILVLMSLQGAVYSVVFLSALTYAPAVYGAAFVPGLQPFVVVVLGFLILAERPGKIKTIAFAICFAGCSIMIIGPSTAPAANLSAGLALFGVSTLMWGSYTFLLRVWSIEPLDALVVIGVSSGILFLPPYFAIREFVALEAPLSALLLQLIYQGVFVGILAALLFASAVQKIGSLSVAALTPTMPALATIIALVTLGEDPSVFQWAGIGLVSIGLIISKSPKIVISYFKNTSTP